MADLVHLREVSLFRSLPEEQLRELAQACRSRTYRRGDALFYSGDEGSAVYILRSGKVKIVGEGADGEERILHLQGAGECLGELSLIDGQPRSATAVAIEPVDAWILSRQSFIDLVDRRPEVARAVMGELAGIVRRLSEQVQEFTTLDVRARLAKKLLQLSERHGQSASEGVQVALPLNQDELAGMIGTTRPSVNTHLKRFEKEGVLSLHREGITVHQPRKLQKAVAEGTREPSG